jgi:hypothetical protein
MFRTPLRVAFATLGYAVAFASCGQDTVAPAGEAKLVLFADVSGTSVSTVVVEVTAPDITTPLVFNIQVSNGVATDTIVVPAGSQRTIAMRAFDGSAIETHSGSTSLNIAPGTNATVTITPPAPDRRPAHHRDARQQTGNHHADWSGARDR